jgi:hypothetical protein
MRISDELVCRHCGGPNETYYFVCFPMLETAPATPARILRSAEDSVLRLARRSEIASTK